MVYELIDRRIVHHKIKQDHAIGAILVTRSVSLGVAATCRQVYEESRPIFASIVEKFILEKTPTIIVDKSILGTYRPGKASYPKNLYFNFMNCLGLANLAALWKLHGDNFEDDYGER